MRWGSWGGEVVGWRALRAGLDDEALCSLRMRVALGRVDGWQRQVVTPRRGLRRALAPSLQLPSLGFPNKPSIYIKTVCVFH